MIQILVWWVLIQVLGWLALPTSMRIFRWLPDRGYSFSKALGLLLISYFLWIGASTGLLNNDLGGILFAVVLVAAISIWFYFRCKGTLLPDIRTFLREKWKMIVTVEVLFTLALVAWAVLRAYAPYKIENTGGEKFMETAFQNAILRSQHFPPLDPWLSGYAISYYYFGYVMMATLTQLSGAVSGVAFDLYDSLLFALALIGSFGVVYNLVAFTLKARHREGESPPRAGPPILAGILGGLLVSMMGNLEGVLESIHARGLLPASFWAWIDIPGLAASPVVNSWYPGNIFLWWWRASRVLADKNFLGQNMIVQPIDEFPFFSFILGDNHPHVLALPFVLLAIGLAFNLLVRQINKSHDLKSDNVDNLPEDDSRDPQVVDDSGREHPQAHWWNPVAYALDNDWLLFVFSGLILGSLGFLNTWDLPIYLGLVMLAYGVGLVMVNGHVDLDAVFRTFILGIGLGILSIVLYIFFYLSFSSQAAGILPYVFPPTRLSQYLVMFGTFIFLVGCFLVGYLRHQEQNWRQLLKSAFYWWWRILVICVGVYLLIMLLIAFVLFLQQRIPGSTLAATIQSVLGGISIREAFSASLSARLRDPWLLLMLSVLLALVITNAAGLLKKRVASEDEALEELVTPLPIVTSDLFVFILIFTGLALTLVVEFLYLRDSFGIRMNTVFKFYYQAWVMLGCAGAYGTWWLLDRVRKPVLHVAFSAGAILFIGLGLIYTVMAIPSRAGDFTGLANLDGASSIASNNPDDWAAIQWLDANAEQGLPTGTVPVILEAPSVPPTGGSYTYDGRISTFTGFPTVLGWAVHESQWRGNYDQQAIREPDIATLYTTSRGQTMLDLLHKWNVNYVIVGQPEMTYIQQVCSQSGTGCTTSSALRKFDQLLQPVFNQGLVTIYKVP
jgi:YYY domain-containing protein